MLTLFCPTACTSDLDVAFIIDGSGSIRDANPADGSYDNWNLLLTFVANVVDNLPVSASGTHVAAVVFSDKGEMLFPFSRYTDHGAVRRAILNTAYPGGNTNTSGGLWVARSQVFTGRNGDRPNVPNVAIVLTDGKSTFDHQRTIPYAEDLRRDGVEMITIGITNSVDEDELKGMSSLPQQQHRNYFTSASFQELEDVMAGLINTACIMTPAPPKSKCSLMLTWYISSYTYTCRSFLCPLHLSHRLQAEFLSIGLSIDGCPCKLNCSASHHFHSDGRVSPPTVRLCLPKRSYI